MTVTTTTPGEERFFEMLEILEAAEWARGGGIAVHRNFDVTGLVIGGRTRQGGAYHVFGRMDLLLEWGHRNGQRPSWVQPGDDAGDFEDLPHFDVFGGPARRLEARMGIPTAAGQEREA